MVAVLLAGVGSFYASNRPDGLEHVAETTGFGDTAQDSGVADGPLAGYGVAGVDHARLSGGLAGVIGVVVVGGLAGGLTLVLRRRRVAGADAAGASDTLTAPGTTED